MDHQHDHEHECIACSQGMDAYMKTLEKTIKRFGHAVVGTYIAGPLPEMAIPTSYTVGLNDVGLPEIVVFGLPMEAATEILNHAADLLRAGELPLDTPIDELANMPTIFKKAIPEYAAEVMGIAIKRSPNGIDAIQMVVPDVNGKFPWEDGCDVKMAIIQPPLCGDDFYPPGFKALKAALVGAVDGGTTLH